MNDNEAKVLILDIETSPLTVWIWKLGEQRVNIDQVKEDWYIMAWTAKWLGDNKLIYRDIRHSKSDKAILFDLWKLLDEADIVVSQNGETFDIPKIEARMMLYGFKPFKPFKHHDTYKELKNKGFTSHKLDYLTDKFCKKYKKLCHKKYPGLKLWIECLKGNINAWNEMQKYNNYDVLSTEELYLNTRGWSTKKAPRIVFNNDPERQCQYCKSFKTQKRGIERLLNKAFVRIQCQSCGKYQRGKQIKV